MRSATLTPTVSRRTFLLSTAMLGAATACSSPSEPAVSSGSLTQLRMGAPVSLTSAHIYVAKGKGYLREEGLDVELVNLLGTDAQPLAASGQIHGYFGTLSAAFFNGLSRGLDVKLLGPNGGISADGRPQIQVVVRKDGPITAVADLRGKKIALPGGSATSSAWQFDRMLSTASVRVEDIEVVEMAAADAPIALTNGQVDAALAFYPVLAQVLTEGRLVVLPGMDKGGELGMGNMIAVGPGLTVDNRDAGVGLLRALNRAVKDLQGNYFDDPEIVRIVSENTSIPADVIRSCPPPGFALGLPFNPSVPQQTQTYFRRLGTLSYQTNIPTEQLLDNQIIQAARV
ncbi:ABC transporter substrate-binding protein [Streptosporangium sp. NPDC001681]|uniref:ABC transporter substrate-binding protein n=1 Tax=Streptosporangium sp. NPDC001681 TaxID=3154395 RepID=UPI00331CC231